MFESLNSSQLCYLQLQSNLQYHIQVMRATITGYLLDTHLHQSIVGIYHTLKSDTFHGPAIRARLVSLSIARRPGTPRITLQWALHDRAIMNANGRTDSSAFETRWVEIIIASPFVIELPRNI
jgi:hypothetical protein